MTSPKTLYVTMILITATVLQGCVHKVVTVPVKAAYTVTKGVVKGTAAVGRAIIPGDRDDDKQDEE